MNWRGCLLILLLVIVVGWVKGDIPSEVYRWYPKEGGSDFTTTFVKEVEFAHEGNAILSMEYNDKNDMIYLVGMLADGNIRLGDTPKLQCSLNVTSGFILALDGKDGKLEWLLCFSKISHKDIVITEAISMGFHPQTNSIVLGGYFVNSNEKSQGDYECENVRERGIFLVYVDGKGNLLWSRIGNSYRYVGLTSVSVQMEKETRIIFTGSFSESFILHRRNKSIHLSAEGYTAGFIVELDEAGKLVDYFLTGGQSGSISEIASTVWDNGIMYLLGTFTGNVTFGDESVYADNAALFLVAISHVEAYEVLYVTPLATENVTTVCPNQHIVSGGGNYTYISGCYNGALALHYETNTTTLFSSLGEAQWGRYLIRLDERGELVWGFNVGGGLNEYMLAMKAGEGESGGVVLMGPYARVISFGDRENINPAVYDIPPKAKLQEFNVLLGYLGTYVIKYTAEGDLSWSTGILGQVDTGDLIVTKDRHIYGGVSFRGYMKAFGKDYHSKGDSLFLFRLKNIVAIVGNDDRISVADIFTSRFAFYVYLVIVCFIPCVLLLFMYYIGRLLYAMYQAHPPPMDSFLQ